MKCHPKPESAKEGSEFLDSSIPKSTGYATKWLKKIFGKVQEEIRTPTLRKEDSKSKWTMFTPLYKDHW